MIKFLIFLILGFGIFFLEHFLMKYLLERKIITKSDAPFYDGPRYIVTFILWYLLAYFIWGMPFGSDISIEYLLD
jgi:hypothetical protein